MWGIMSSGSVSAREPNRFLAYEGSAGRHGWLSEIESINRKSVKRLADRSRPIPGRGDVAPGRDA